MKAIFKENKKLVLNTADANEQLVLKKFIKKANNTENFTFKYTKLLDINGEINGLAIELVNINPEVHDDLSEPSENEPTEPSTPTNIEG